MKDFLKNLDLSKDELPANAKGVDVEKVPVKVDKIDVGVSNLLNIIKFYYNATTYLLPCSVWYGVTIQKPNKGQQYFYLLRWNI